MGNTSRILQRLYSLDDSSPDFLRYLRFLIQRDEEEQYLINLKEPELARLLGFLEKALDVIPTNSDIAQECLEKLQDICVDCGTLPPSHIEPGELVRVGDRPIAVGVGFDLWEGTYRGKEVYIVSVEGPSGDYGGGKKSFICWAILRKRLNHPNLVPFIGATVDPPQIVAERMPRRGLIEYLEEHPEANRIGLLLDLAEGLDYLYTNESHLRLFNEAYLIIDREGRARVTAGELPPTITQPSWLPPEVGGGSSSTPVNEFTFGIIVIEVFTGMPPFDEFAPQVIASKILDGIRPDRPQGAQELGLTNSLWEMTVRCWHPDPTQRPNTKEMVNLLRKLLMSSLSMEAHLHSFFEVCKSRGRDGQQEKAQEFADELDEALENAGLLQEKRKQYLKYLQKLCSTFGLLPSSFLLPQESVKQEPFPFDSGGYSSVFRATFGERAVVIKVLNVVAQAERERFHRLLVKEVIGWKWLRHENVLPFVGVMFTPPTPISIASELMDNGNIMDFVRKHQDHNRVHLLVGAVTGLEYLHEHNIVHGDLKGVNILVDSQCRARLADFGLAKIVDGSTSRTTTAVGRKLGTIRWMAPELLYPDMFEFTGRFEKQLPSKGTDTYAIGMTILEVITGCVPFASVPRNETVILKVVKGDRPDRPPSGLSEMLWDLLGETWVEQYAQKPRNRPPVSTVLTRLKECIGDWGKSIIPLVPEDWENTDTDDDDDDPTITASNFQQRVVDEEFERFGLFLADFSISLSQLNRPAQAEPFGRA